MKGPWTNRYVKQVKDFREFFSLSGLATSIFLGLAPSAWDTGSDFAFAKVFQSGLKSSDLSRFVQAETENDFISTLTYLIISLPGIFIAFTGVSNRVSQCWYH